MDQLSSVWAYITLGAVSFITEEFAPISGGVAAHNGHLVIIWVASSCALGTWAADIGLYWLGRWRGAWVRNRWPRVGRAFTRTLMSVRRAPWRSSLAVRYAYGLRITLPIACGAAHVPVAQVARSGFETAIAVPAGTVGPDLAVQALAASGSVLGTSPTTAQPSL